ncbi:hypothetical protein [Streptomyces swartbergensis]|uniref:Uncharacterized protein n=1 Tax=Streptomyces swartbergensis TaxID=487165 RepID=A0A243SAG2_9ACTN|nr:hypothetical protein [Streptomyces swartbergensis]OUD04667.1 hypothetical protein CA983_02610 [Streptomyces swartbergensis]
MKNKRAQELKDIQAIVDQVAKAVAEEKPKKDRTPVNINTGVLHGGQHVNNVVISGDYIPGNKNGKKGKK